MYSSSTEKLNLLKCGMTNAYVVKKTKQIEFFEHTIVVSVKLFIFIKIDLYS